MGMMINRRRVYGDEPYDDRFVDLGLPSGTLWAKGNIIKDANGVYAIGEPEDYGCYFSWANIEGHNIGEGYDFSQNVYNDTPGADKLDNISPNDAEHDAAVALIGGCHLPTREQLRELFDANNTINQWTGLNGATGRLVTSLNNGNSVFLRAAGIYNGKSNYHFNTVYFCWSSSYYESSKAWVLYFDNTSVNTYNRNLANYCGITIRPVK